ncbi:putative DNA topoisomerase [Lupinus albus]|uniref:Putative DNA topoisomerase n=1 Tax=Lupinus albus TaxID=3870 RepID=A0A6A4QWP3_LUPAL|nr:putative DNA topoisomerase [Lupinus albus]
MSDDDEADIVGCCTLKVENVTPEAPNKLQVLSFTVEVELPVYNAILKFQKGRKLLNKDTKDGDAAEKIVVYNHANKQAVLKELKIDLDRARKGKPPLKSSDGKTKRNLTPEA